MNSSPIALGHRFLASAARFPDRAAITAEERTLTYSELKKHSETLAATLLQFDTSQGPGLTGVFAERSVTAFSGVLAALLRGHGYVPLNPSFPVDRIRTTLVRSGVRIIIVDQTAEQKLGKVLEGIDQPLTLILPERANVQDLADRWPQHRFIGQGDLFLSGKELPQDIDQDSIAYLLFTSGSTGQPKGVMVSHRNVSHFLDFVLARYSVNENDRLSQMFELSFDLSVFDLFVAWSGGACVCCPSKMQCLTPGNYIIDSNITIWFSVPSLGVLMKGLRLLEAGAYPNLRLSLFCGEALTADLAKSWAKAAPNSVVENLYGPTELTIACSVYRWDENNSPAESNNGIVPIGTPFPGMETLVVNESLLEVGPGETGELLMTGPQVTLGYYQDPEKTMQAFVKPPGMNSLYYRTGDLVSRPVASAVSFQYQGRVDHQIKIHGSRVELGEIESALREAAAVDQAIAVGWPVNAGGADGIVAFVGPTDIDPRSIQKAISGRLPGYMVPREYRTVEEFPLNANGKVDRKALIKLLENEIN